jgi:hypothetical protein
MFSIVGGVDYLFGGTNQIRKLPIAIAVGALLVMVLSLFALIWQIQQGIENWPVYLSVILFVVSSIVVAVNGYSLRSNAVAG